MAKEYCAEIDLNLLLSRASLLFPPYSSTYIFGQNLVYDDDEETLRLFFVRENRVGRSGKLVERKTQTASLKVESEEPFLHLNLSELEI